MLARALISGIALIVLAPAAVAAGPANGAVTFDGVQVVPSCSSSPGGSSQFQFVVINRRPASVEHVRLDVYFGNDARLTSGPGYRDLRTPLHIAGHHAWRSVQFLEVYSGFALQPVVHPARSGTQRVVFALTVQGLRHTFPAWVCSGR